MNTVNMTAKNIIICAILKNEHKYLKEFIEYHLSIGFTHIYLFEDYDSISHKNITDNYSNVTLRTLEEYGIELKLVDHGWNRQFELYKKFLNENKGKVDWIAMIDIDEYITFEEGYTLDKLTTEFAKENGLYLCWKEFGADGLVFEDDRPLHERFINEGVMPKKEETYAMKSFVNMNVSNGKLEGLHHAERLCTTCGLHSQRLIKNYHKAYITHYFTKSWQEWCSRWLRGENSWGDRTLDYFFEVNPDMEKNKEYLHSLAKEWLGDDLFYKATN